jgi:transcriptional regulator with XRE-family HTH domain
MAQVAQRAHCSISTLSDYERGVRVPRDEALVRTLAEIIGLSREGTLARWRAASTPLGGTRASRHRPALPGHKGSLLSRPRSWSRSRNQHTRFAVVLALAAAWTIIVVLATRAFVH